MTPRERAREEAKRKADAEMQAALAETEKQNVAAQTVLE